MSKEQLKMPRLYQDKKWGTWYVEFERGVARSLRTKNQAEARKRFNIIKRRWSEGKLAHLTGHCSKTLGEFYKEFKEWSSLNQPRSTSRANILALEKLRSVAGDHIKLNELSLLHLDRMITECRRSTKEKPGGLSIASINNYIRHARAALNKAVDWNFITVNPLRKAKELPAPRKAPGFIPTLPEITRFLQSISDLDARRLAAAYLTTGRRRSEILGLHWDEVDLQGKRYFIRRSKNHSVNLVSA
jgi:integrase